MLKYILKRILILIPVLLGVCFVIFTLLSITPGDPAQILLGDSATEERIVALRHEMGLDQPFLIRYARYVYDIVVHRDLGISYSNRLPVSQLLAQAFPNTLQLATLAMTLAVFFGMLAGIISAVRQYSMLDNVVMTVALVGVSMPAFWLGLLLILLFSLRLGWLPSSGFDTWKHLVLPAVTAALPVAAYIARQTRSSMLEVIRQDYIDTARAKGQKEIVVILRHALKNSLIPVVTVIGIQFGIMLGGAIVTEQVFSIPGIGKLMIDAIQARNYPVVQGAVLYIAVCFSVINLAVDILYTFIDPRLKTRIR